jgi:hypothetical protein
MSDFCFCTFIALALSVGCIWDSVEAAQPWKRTAFQIAFILCLYAVAMGSWYLRQHRRRSNKHKR